MAGASFCFRCDSSASIGMGHAIRCLALAQALRRTGASALFVTRGRDAGAADRFTEASFPCVAAPAGEETLSEEDLGTLVRAAREAEVRCVVLDHYGASTGYLEGLVSAGFGLAVLDDTGDRDLSPAAWILNQNLDAERLDLLSAPDATVLLGPRYALVRESFLAARQSLTRRFEAGDHRVLLTLGGGAVAEDTARALEALSEIPVRLEIRGIVRTGELDHLHLREALRSTPHQVTLLESPKDLSDSMAWADISVNAGGSTCWELACLGVPMVVASMSRDQAGNAAGLVARGCAVAVDGTRFEGLGSIVAELLAHAGQRRALSLAASALVDGRGADRAARALLDTFAGGHPWA